MAEMQTRDPKMVGMSCLVELLRVYTDRDLSMRFIGRSAGLRVPLAWPQGYFFVISGIVELDMYSEDDVLRWTKLLCCPEKLQIFAYVVKGSRSFRRDSPILLLGSAGRVYATLPWKKHEIWRVGDSLDSFLKRGLARMNSFRDACNAPPVVVDPPQEMLRIGGRSHLLAFRSRNLGNSYPLTWPKGDTISFDKQSRDSFCNTEKEVAAEVRAMTFLATFGPATFSGSGRVSLYVDRRGAIFAFDDNFGRLLLMAESFPRFLHVGPRPFFKSYLFTSEGYARRHRPLCPRSLAYLKKIEWDVSRDLVLRAYYESHCFGGTQHGADGHRWSGGGCGGCGGCGVGCAGGVAAVGDRRDGR